MAKTVKKTRESQYAEILATRYEKTLAQCSVLGFRFTDESHAHGFHFGLMNNRVQYLLFDSMADGTAVVIIPKESEQADRIRQIKRVLRPKKHQCYRNAALLTELFPGRVKYVEGFGWNRIVKVEHAFNRVGDKYVDITWEMVLKENVTTFPYVALIEAERDDVMADIQAHDNTTGDYYLHKYIERLGGERALARLMDEQAVETLEKGGAISQAIKKAGTL